MRARNLWMALVLTAAPCFAMNSGVEAAAAQLAVPFGVAEGQLIEVGDFLVFADVKDPMQSFAVSRPDVVDLNANADVVTLVTRAPILGRANFSFKVADAATAGRFASWLGERSANVDREKPADVFTRSYVVRHKRTIGADSQGRLVITGDRLSYESITDIDKSRSWTLGEIKEFKHKNPYRIEVSPFVGDSYTFELVGVGLSSEDYKYIADRITELRLR